MSIPHTGCRNLSTQRNDVPMFLMVYPIKNNQGDNWISDSIVQEALSHEIRNMVVATAPIPALILLLELFPNCVSVQGDNFFVSTFQCLCFSYPASLPVQFPTPRWSLLPL